jgi:hypothetical protein
LKREDHTPGNVPAALEGEVFNLSFEQLRNFGLDHFGMLEEGKPVLHPTIILRIAEANAMLRALWHNPPEIEAFGWAKVDACISTLHLTQLTLEKLAVAPRDAKHSCPAYVAGEPEGVVLDLRHMYRREWAPESDDLRILFTALGLWGLKRVRLTKHAEVLAVIPVYSHT